MKKPSLQAALNDTPAKKTIIDTIIIESETKKLIVEIPTTAHYQLDKMRLEMHRPSMKVLVVEALNDLFKKYDYPTIS